MSADNQTCSKRNIHGRKLKDISRVTIYIWSHTVLLGLLLFENYRLHHAYTFPLRNTGSYFMGLIEITEVQIHPVSNQEPNFPMNLLDF